MTQLTTKEIGAQLQRSDLTAAVYQDLVSAISARRRTVSERLVLIEDTGAVRRAAVESGNSDTLVKLNREAEALDDELGILYAHEPRAFKLHLAAIERETIEAGRRGHRRIAQVLADAERALAAYTNALQRLDEVTSAIGGANDIAQQKYAALGGEQSERLVVDDATLDRILGVTMPPFLVREEQRLGSHAFLRSRICAPVSQQYGEPLPDRAEQMHAAMFQRRDS